MHVQRIIEYLVDARMWLGLEQPHKAKALIGDIKREASPVHLKRFEAKIEKVLELIEKETAR